MSTVKEFYGRHHVLFDPYKVAISKLMSDLMASVEALWPDGNAFDNRMIIFTDLFHRYIDMAVAL